jgi:putative ABC transport system permease protein
MNPLPLVLAEVRSNLAGCAAVVALIAVAVALGAAISAQERALRVASARAADRFDLVVGAAGNPTQLVLTTVYLQPAALDLIAGQTLLDLQQREAAAAVAPVAVTDSYRGFPVVGTTAAFATQDGKLGPVEGRGFESAQEAVIGAAVDLPLGARFRPSHGTPAENVLETRDHAAAIAIVGRLARTGTPWDRAIVVPIETIWSMHAEEPPGVDRGNASALGPPWTAATAGPVPAVVVRPRSVTDAYQLRSAFRGHGTMALFPAEVLNPLYALLGDIRDLMRAMAVAFDALLMAAVLLLIAAVLAARRNSLGVLRALGAPPAFIFVAVWLHGALLVAAGGVLGTVLGAIAVQVLGAVAGSRLGFALDATIGAPEIRLVLALLAAGSLLAALPSLLTLRAPVARLLRDA